MYTKYRSLGFAAVSVFCLLHCAQATSVPRLSFEQLIDSSDIILTGNVVRTWSAWDSNHKYIWTHFEVSVTDGQKGVVAGTAVELAEPGGIVGGMGMSIAGSVNYTPGENVVIFAQRMPNGYLRTTGWAQGKYAVGGDGLLRGDTAFQTSDLLNTTLSSATSLRTLDGISVRELKARVAARIRAVYVQGKVQ